MKSILVIALCFIYAATALESTESQQSLQVFPPFGFCTVRDMTMGFFTGTEKDPVHPNSRCVQFFPRLEEQFNMFVGGVNETLLIPTNFVRWINTGVVLINQYAAWQNYCTFATVLTRLDNAVETMEGLATLVFRVMNNYPKLFILFADITTGFTNENCVQMSKAAGGAFSVIFDFNVPEDVV
ncbi:unnamed protein product [Moneuplotes crassus]|uniref:Uncharacterized protein n=1 Tax=Euplotes crassus TaxID=5936 RepID=A0AAD1XZT9_EUPCR|nr:unnamed protein product [Moneuplotes crassus]